MQRSTFRLRVECLRTGRRWQELVDDVHNYREATDVLVRRYPMFSVVVRGSYRVPKNGEVA